MILNVQDTGIAAVVEGPRDALCPILSTAVRLYEKLAFEEACNR